MEIKKCDKETGKTIIKDEIEAFANGRYYDSSQSCHRIFGFQMCHRFPPVIKLQLHLENQQPVVFEDQNVIEALEKNEKTQLTEFFKLNVNDSTANGILYPDIPSMYTWQTTKKKWQKRVQKRTGSKDGTKMSPMVGRIPIIPLNTYSKETFFLRVLLYHVRGPKSFEHLRTVVSNGETKVCPTFHMAAIELGLTENDNEAELAMQQAFDYTNSDNLLKCFFVNLVIHQMPADPWALFQKFKKELCSRKLYEAKLEEPTDTMLNEILLELQTLFEKQDKDMKEFIGAENMPDQTSKPKYEPKELKSETNFDPEEQAEIARMMEKSLNEGQRKLVNSVINAIDRNEGGVFCVEAHGGKLIFYVFGA